MSYQIDQTTLFYSFDEWKDIASKLGHVHVEDGVVVCDDENGTCIGEFENEFGGFIYTEFLKK